MFFSILLYYVLIATFTTRFAEKYRMSSRAVNIPPVHVKNDVGGISVDDKVVISSSTLPWRVPPERRGPPPNVPPHSCRSHYARVCTPPPFVPR